MRKSNRQNKKVKMNGLEKIGPELSKITKKHPFRVPENYFDDFSVRLEKNIKSLEAEKAEHKMPQSFIVQFVKPSIGIAAAITLIVMLILWPPKSFMPDYLTKYKPANEETITEDEQLLFLIEKIDINSFLTLLQESSAEKTEESEFNDEELLNYLTANISEYDLFIGNTY